MKIFIRVFSVVLVASMINCSKSGSIVNISIAGKWRYSSTVISDCTNASNNNNSPCTSSCSTVTFTSNAFVTNDSNGTQTGSGTYSISGSNISITMAGSGTTTYTFTVVGNTLSIISSKNNTTGCVTTSSYVKA